ncbi:hypothetical protein TW80_04355 [Loktanella sp. S4079]|nr:hypothetical protein TW80_04355 [Loktanella sp. S4079]
MNGGCSADGVDYFCRWLISRDHATFDKISSDRENLSDCDQSEDILIHDYGDGISEIYRTTATRTVEIDFLPLGEPKGTPFDATNVENQYPHFLGSVNQSE